VCKQKGNSFCTELGPEVASWSRRAPLEKPKWIEESLEELSKALNLAEVGKGDEARKVLQQSPDLKLRKWFSDHGQNSGVWRQKALSVPTPVPIAPLDLETKLNKFEVPIFTRDNCHCRYCGSKVIAKKDFKKMQRLLGEEDFPLKGGNEGRSGYFLMFCASLDHVFPRSLGGATDEENLVTCCWPCNYGKSNYTLGQIGLDDPFARAPTTEPTWMRHI
jgi:5-methylcytosine-specific restriction endonuclease McrA